MKAFILLAVFVVVRGTAIPFVPAVAVQETGASAQFRSEDSLGNYNFGYNEDHTSGGTFRREAGDAHGNVAGSYGLRDADGRIRIVNYVANDDGFKADIKTNEPGVEPKDTADATFNKAESVVVQSAVAVPAPAPIVAIPAAEPVALKTEQVAISSPVFPPVSAVPVAKTFVAEPVTYTFPEPAAEPVAKTVITTETRPVTYTFPEVVAPVAKSVTTVSEAKPIAYAFPEPAAPVAKTHTTVTETRPIPYAFPPAAAVTKSQTTTIKTEAQQPVAYAFPEPAAPVAKSIAAAPIVVPEPAPVAYSFPPAAAVPVAKSSSLSYAAAPVAPLTYSAVPASKYAYSSQVAVNNAPAHYAVKGAAVNYAPGAVAYAPALRYAINPHLTAFRYATPYYKSLYSPVVASFAGPVPYFNNIEYHGYPILKK